MISSYRQKNLSSVTLSSWKCPKYEKLNETDGTKYRVKFVYDGYSVDKIQVPSYEVKNLVTRTNESLAIYRLSKSDRILLGSFCDIHGIDIERFTFDNIEEISYGRKVLYLKDKGVV